MVQATLEEAKHTLSDLINAAIGGEEVLIVNDDKKKIKLVPLSPPHKKPVFGSSQGKIKITEDFDSPLNDFNDYVA